MKHKITAVFLTVCLIFTIFCGCSPSFEKTDKFTVICSIFAPYDFARQIAGEKADVKMLLPAGVESHSYEPTPSDIIELENADLFFYVSDSAETWVNQIISSVESKNLKKIEIAEELGIELHEHEHHKDEGEDEAYEADEHIWTSLKTAKKMVDCICEKICEADPENSDYYKANADDYNKQIAQLDKDFQELTSNSKRNEIVSGSRFALKNFILDYNIKYTAAFDSCVDNTEPSAGVLANIIDTINNDKIPVIFYEELTEPKISRAVADETGAKMLLLHSCHNVSSTELKSGETYVSLMKHNYFNLKEALN